MSSSILVDRVKIIALSSGTGPFAAGPAVPGYRGVEALIDGATYSYAVAQNAAFEVGQLVWNLSTGQFLRTPQISSSGNAAVPFAAGAEINFTARAADLIAIGGSFPIVNALGVDPNVAIAQQAASAAINGKIDSASLAAVSGSALVGTASNDDLQTNLNQRIAYRSTRAAIKALDVTLFSVAFLNENGRQGNFRLKAGTAPTDPQEGLYLPSTTTGYYWERVWDGTRLAPEKFGAKSGDPTFDNRTAFNACLALVPVMELGAADYWVQGRWQITQNHRLIQGAGRNTFDEGPGTCIKNASSTLDMVLIGTDTDPGAINNYVRYVDFANVTFWATSAPTPPAGTSRQGGPSCLKMKYALNCRAIECATINGTNGFYLTAAVFCKVIDSSAQRIIAGTTGTNDYFIGCMLDGSPSIPANTGIASCYIDHFQVTGTTNTLINYGVYTANGFTDMFITAVETSGVQDGIILNGGSGTYASEDCSVTACVLDQCNRGIVINAGVQTTAIILANNYVGVAASPTGGIGIAFVNTPSSGNGGSVSLLGNQVIGQGGASVGLLVDHAAGLIASGNIWTDLNAPVQLVSAARIKMSDRFSNPLQSAAAGVEMTASARVVMDNVFDGKPNAFTDAYKLTGAGNVVVEVRVTGVDTGAVSGNKINNNGAAVVAAGAFGTGSIAQGSFA